LAYPTPLRTAEALHMIAAEHASNTVAAFWATFIAPPLKDCGCFLINTEGHFDTGSAGMRELAAF